MIGILIITHETLGAAYRSLAKHFFMDAEPENIRILGVEHHQDHDDIIQKAQDIIQDIDTGNGVLVLTDIFGATPCNAARKLVLEDQVTMLTGINAPMMIKATQHCSRYNNNLLEFTQMVKEAAINGILDITSPPEESC